MRGFLIALMFVAFACRADVTHVSPSGFVSEHNLILAATPAQAYNALTEQVHLWWDATHSFSGEAHAFSLDTRPGGCFCELQGDIGVAHLRVVNVVKGRSLVMQGGLGPLQSMAVSGSMSFSFAPHPDGTELNYRYVVGGYTPGGLEAMAKPVDQVQLGQLQRLAAFLARGKALNPEASD